VGLSALCLVPCGHARHPLPQTVAELAAQPSRLETKATRREGRPADRQQKRQDETDTDAKARRHKTRVGRLFRRAVNPQAQAGR
jgi:hypothetical protein